MSEKNSFRDIDGKNIAGQFEVSDGKITVTIIDGRTKTAEVDERMLGNETLAKMVLLQMHRQNGGPSTPDEAMPRSVVIPCPACGDTGWVCEEHADLPVGRSPERVQVRRARDAVPDCNEPADGERPRRPRGFMPTFDRDEGPINWVMCGPPIVRGSARDRANIAKL